MSDQHVMDSEGDLVPAKPPKLIAPFLFVFLLLFMLLPLLAVAAARRQISVMIAVLIFRARKSYGCVGSISSAFA